MAESVETAVQELKQVIQANDGINVADRAFARRVDQLISVFYDDIGEIRYIAIGSLFDLFLIKVLYVERGSRDASVLDYLGGMLTRYLYTRELFPIVRGGRRFTFYLSDLLDETQRLTHFQNLFEAYRKFADNALFISGIFSASLRGGRRGRRGVSRYLDRSYYVSTGKTCYRLAAQHKLADLTQQRRTLTKLADYFEIYMDALNEASERYILGFDLNLIADKMLDNFNLYRRTGEEKYLENARKYAAILRVDEARFPALFRRPRGTVL
ncbi:MAG: hypothetical protein Q8P22_05390 [Chloroflexota bacterium]|nr:hypothetical protein [Chloroflexota bacterium]